MKGREARPAPVASRFDPDAKSLASTEVCMSPVSKRMVPPASFEFSCEALPQRCGSVLLRPRRSDSKVNKENLDVEHKRNIDAFERHANIYRCWADQPYHHNKPVGSVPTLWEQGHIVDKGKRQFGAPSQKSNILDQIGEPKGAPEADNQQLPKATPGITRADKKVQQQRGSYNPVLHEYSQPVDPAYDSQRQREFDLKHGSQSRGRPTLRTSDNIWDLFRSPEEFRQQQDMERTAQTSAAPGEETGPGSAHVSSRPGWVGSVGGAVSAGARNGQPSQGLDGVCHRRRPLEDGRGKYNYITHTWAHAPDDLRVRDQDDGPDGYTGIGAKGKVPTPHGVYNPILNKWVVPPNNPRVAAGLTFAPANVFLDVNPSTRGHPLPPALPR